MLNLHDKQPQTLKYIYMSSGNASEKKDFINDDQLIDEQSVTKIKRESFDLPKDQSLLQADISPRNSFKNQQEVRALV